MGANLRDWHKIVNFVQDLNLHEERDIFVWALHPSRSFYVKSIYAVLISNGIRVLQDIWQIKVPTKVIFLWYLTKDMILTKDNLVRRH